MTIRSELAAINAAAEDPCTFSIQELMDRLPVGAAVTQEMRDMVCNAMRGYGRRYRAYGFEKGFVEGHVRNWSEVKQRSGDGL